VGAFDINGAIAPFSGRGPSAFGGIVKPNVSAPGVNVRSSVPTDSYANFDGTSMATPHASGAVALMWSAAPALVGNIDETRAIIDQTAIDTEDLTCGGEPANNNVWGEGKLDVLAAVEQSPRGDTATLAGTVTDAATGDPIAGATVTATGEIDRTATTDEDGAYELSLVAGSFDVSVEVYGYGGETTTVDLTAGETTTLDFALDPLPTAVVSGTVTDGSGHGWPLYARIDIDGYPLGPVFTDPVTGAYSVELVEATDFTFNVSVGGYVTESRPVTVPPDS
jgi:subtilisin family serine protease